MGKPTILLEGDAIHPEVLDSWDNMLLQNVDVDLFADLHTFLNEGQECFLAVSDHTCPDHDRGWALVCDDSSHLQACP